MSNDSTAYSKDIRYLGLKLLDDPTSKQAAEALYCEVQALQKDPVELPKFIKAGQVGWGHRLLGIRPNLKVTTGASGELDTIFIGDRNFRRYRYDVQNMIGGDEHDSTIGYFASTQHLINFALLKPACNHDK